MSRRNNRGRGQLNMNSGNSVRKDGVSSNVSSHSQESGNQRGRGRGRGKNEIRQQDQSSPETSSTVDRENVRASFSTMSEKRPLGIGRGRGRIAALQQDQTRPGTSSSTANGQNLGTPSVSSTAEDIASVKSSGSREQEAVKKEAPGGLNKKSLTEKEKNRLMSQIPRRKYPNKGGIQGRPIQVFTNMVQIIFDQSKFPKKATHYDIKFDPDKPKYLKRLAFDKLREEKFADEWPAFDGNANVFSAGDLPFGNSIEHTVQVSDPKQERDRTIKITMEKVNDIDMSWLPKVAPGFREEERDQTSMQVLDIVLRMAQFNPSTISVGRSFFQQPKSQPFNLRDGMELRVGMFQSAVLGWKPYFNVDVVHKAFPKSINVIDAMKDLCADRNGPPREITINMVKRNSDKIYKFLKGLKIVFQLPNNRASKRTFGVKGLGEPADEASFTLNNRVITVDEYFNKTKGYRIKYPKVPCISVGPKDKNILLPAELCTIDVGTGTNKKLNPVQTRNMIKEAAKAPENRKNQILEAFKSVEFSNNPTMKKFGLSLNGQLEKVNARVLNPPRIKYNVKEDKLVKKGTWEASKFLTPQNIPEGKWTILNLSPCQEGFLEDFAFMLQQFEKSNGIAIGKPHRSFGMVSYKYEQDTGKLKEYLEEQKKNGMQLILVVIPENSANIYAKVKQVAELQVGILTQCIKEQTIKKCVEKNHTSTVGNIILKINSKLNGVNHTFLTPDRKRLECLKNSIIFGADVTHPSPDATNIPSIAAVAASRDDDVFKYSIEMKLQPARQEIILQLEDIVYNQLRNYFELNEQKPEKIFFYRDGVSEGQFLQVMHFELQAIKNACRKFGQPEKYEPKITFLVVQKRHHIRLFPADGRNSDDRGGNVQAGTIVDTEITHPSHIDFYLVSHASIQGTARPTKYRCLWDDNNMSEDDIETLTYYLCHMFSRCTRSVSYPAPTYYAHLAAYRARQLIHGKTINMNNLAKEQRDKLTLNSEFMQNNPMFFV